MSRRRFRAAAVCGILLGACRSAPPASFPAPTRSDTARSGGRFYAKRPYGSEAQFNPFSTLINEGYDQLRTSPHRGITERPYGLSATTVWRSVTHPDRVLRTYGVGRWLRNEVFPLSLKGSGGGQWYPNYQLHLWAGGMTYARTVEWYQRHGVTSHPRLAAGASVYAFHFLNEMMENGALRVDNADAMTDLLLFDAAAIALWNQAWMQRLFSGDVEMTNWSGQPSIAANTGTIENAYSMTMLRVPLPHLTNWKAMMTAGNAFLVGASRRMPGDRWVSVSGGFDAAENPVIDPATGRKTATLYPNFGVFFDRESSLLVSLIARGGIDVGPTLNVYPGVVRFGAWSPAFWIQHARGGGVRFGLTSPIGVGVGATAR